MLALHVVEEERERVTHDPLGREHDYPGVGGCLRMVDRISGFVARRREPVEQHHDGA